MIKTLITNVKIADGDDALHRFRSPFVLVHGRNGGGKSAIINGLELACFGKVCDVVGKDIKLKRYLEYLSADGATVHALVHTSDNLRLSYPEKPSDIREKYIDAMSLALDAIKGSKVAFAKFLLKYLQDDVELSVPIYGWDAVVTSAKNHREALLRVEESTNKKLRTHRAKLKELEIACKYVRTDDELHQQRMDEEQGVDDAKRAIKAINREMSRFVKEAAPGLLKYMERFLPEGMGNQALVMSDSDFTLGFANRPYPSGAETVALAAALGAAVLPADSSIYIFPDRAYDEITLGGMMRAARTIPAVGVYIQSTVTPSNYDAEKLGWQILKV